MVPAHFARCRHIVRKKSLSRKEEGGWNFERKWKGGEAKRVGVGAEALTLPSGGKGVD